MKEMAEELSTLLAFIFQQSLDTGEVPRDWWISKIVPVFKKGDPSMACN